MNPWSLFHGGNQDGQVVNECWAGDNHKEYKNEKSPSKANGEQEEGEIESVEHDNYRSATKSPSPTIKEEIRLMFVKLMFCWITVKILAKEHGMASLENLASLSDDEITSICDLIRRPGGLIIERI